MESDSLHWSIVIQDPASLLGWLMIITAMASLAMGMIMTAVQPFFFLPDNSSFKMMQLELPRKLDPFRNIVTTASEKVKGAIRLQLSLDYIFMVFAYGFMFFTGALIIHLAEKHNGSLGSLKVLLIAPFVAWTTDIIENVLISSSLSRYSPTKTRVLYFVSLTKWTIVYLYGTFFLLLFLWWVFV
ncbi:MAG: hypothetical protein C5B52_08460 [Bacteroidetes bacterium]|nr:MAG: hypothetical protein C5B52_08460 [Bacteroidota bacterium]